MPRLTKPDPTAAALRDTFISPNEADSNLEPANVVDGLFAIARAIRFAGKHLGKEDATDPQGAIEFLAGCVKDGADAVACSLASLAQAVEALESPIHDISLAAGKWVEIQEAKERE